MLIVETQLLHTLKNLKDEYTNYCRKLSQMYDQLSCSSYTYISFGKVSRGSLFELPYELH